MNFLISGVGGQGTVLSSKIIAAAFMNKGHDVKTCETIGMAQRGGSVVSHVRVGSDIHSPLIPLGKADMLIGFEPSETVRMLPYLDPDKKDATVILSDMSIMPPLANVSKNHYSKDDMLKYLKENVTNLIILNGQEIIDKCRSAKVLNTALIFVAAGTGKMGITPDDVEAVLKNLLKPHLFELNMKARDIANMLLK